jgi:trimeric autotransporter adhesin
MHRHSTHTASFFSVLIAALIFWLSLAGVAAAQDNTSLGTGALQNNTTGSFNTAIGTQALFGNTTGSANTASGASALFFNTTGNNNTAIGFGANVITRNLNNATAIGAGVLVNASNKIRLGNAAVTVIEGQVAFTASSDKTKKENFEPVDGEEVLGKIRGFELSSWNFIGHDPEQFRHYGPMAQDFYAAFGHDGVGQIGSETTINSGDLAGVLMIAVQALEKRTAELKQKEAQIAALAARLEALELRQNQSIQIAAEDPWVFVAR